MPLYTITNVPPAEAVTPTALADWTALVVAITGFAAVAVWPVVVVIGLISYRMPLSRFIDRIRAAKAFGFDVDADVAKLAVITEAVEVEAAAEKAEEAADAAETADAAATADDAPTVPVEAGSSDASPEGAPPVGWNDRSKWVLMEHEALRRFLEASPDPAIPYGLNPNLHVRAVWDEVGDVLRQLAHKHGARFGSTPVKIRTLERRGVLSPTLGTLLIELYRYSSEASSMTREFTAKEARQIRASGRTAIRELNELLAAGPSIPPPPSPPPPPYTN